MRQYKTRRDNTKLYETIYRVNKKSGISAIFADFWDFFVRMVRVTPTIENFTIWRIFWVFEVPKKKFFLPFFKARKFILTSKLPFMILSSFLRFYWFLMNTFWKNDENPRTIFRAFSGFFQKVAVRNLCKSLWSILFIYFIDWTWFQL